MITALLLFLGAALGLVLGLFGPVLFAAVTGTGGSGSYEAFLPYWLVTLPVGPLLGGWAGYLVGQVIRKRRTPEEGRNRT